MSCLRREWSARGPDSGSDERGAHFSGPASSARLRPPGGRAGRSVAPAPFSCRRSLPYLSLNEDPDPFRRLVSAELKPVSEAPKEKRSVYREADALARNILSRIVRTGLTVGGLILVVGGVLSMPLPGPFGLPVAIVGLMMVLRGSFRAKREFLRFQNRHPRFVRPLRRLLRRDPEFVPFAWQQSLRIERLILPKRFRFLVKSRKKAKGRRKAAT